ncbi:hypothetical protein FH972_023939 [Carpinus fangiana]|uniref:Uncharacterized protein n=1 Tax=Carpinus fangiana TaxID=176857 RepID=A0A5N6KWY9_9ROSI|nr:hypothetical protein FH972_023939 [Carpinus fangiana]
MPSSLGEVLARSAIRHGVLALCTGGIGNVIAAVGDLMDINDALDAVDAMDSLSNSPSSARLVLCNDGEGCGSGAAVVVMVESVSSWADEASASKALVAASFGKRILGALYVSSVTVVLWMNGAQFDIIQFCGQQERTLISALRSPNGVTVAYNWYSVTSEALEERDEYEVLASS